METFLTTCSSSLLSKLLVIEDNLGQTPLLAAVAANATDVVDEQSAFNQARRDTKTRKSKALLSTRGCAKLKAELYPLDDRTVNASLRDMAALEIAIREACAFSIVS